MPQAQKDQLEILIPTFTQVMQGKYPSAADKFADLTPADLVVSDVVFNAGKVTASVSSPTRHFSGKNNQSWTPADINSLTAFELSTLDGFDGTPTLEDLAHATVAGAYAYLDGEATKVAIVVLEVEGSTTGDLAEAAVSAASQYILGGQYDTVTGSDTEVVVETPYLAGELAVVVGGQPEELGLGETYNGQLET